MAATTKGTQEAAGQDAPPSASTSSIARLRGAVNRVISDSRQDQLLSDDDSRPGRKKQQPHLWSEVARGFRKASDAAAAAAAANRRDAIEGSTGRGGKRIVRSLYEHLDSTFNKPASNDQDGLRVEDFLELRHLQRVKLLFEDESEAPLRADPADGSGGGGGGAGGEAKPRSCRRRRKGRLSLAEFQEALSRVVGHNKFAGQLERMFHKLDTNNNGAVSWPEFCNYMMLYLHERDRLSSRIDPPFKADPRLRHVLHNKQEPTARLLLTESPTRPISVSKTGCIMLWDCLLKLESHLETQHPPAELSGSPGKRLFSEWVMDAVYMDNCHKLVLSTTGRELKFYDIASNVIKEEYVLYGMKSVPTVLKFYYKKEAANTDSYLFSGDDSGSLAVLKFKRPMQQLFDLPADPNHQSQRVWYHELGQHSKCLDFHYHEALHPEPVNDMAYLPDNGFIVTCSSSPSSSVVIYDLSHRRPVYTFKLRRGVECFDISWSLNLLVTGSHDHLVRFWNPYVPSKHTGLLEGHNNAVLSVRIHEKLGCALSYARDGVIKAWDIRAQMCVQTVNVRIPYAVSDKLPDHMGTPMTLHVASSTVYLVCSDNIVQYRLGKAADPIPGLILTHKAQLCSAIYNPLFKQVTTASDDSSMTTWDLETGNKCLAFASAHNGEEITCLGYDSTWRRLMTGSRHGNAKVWNFQTGQLLHELEKTADAEITGLVAAPMQQRLYSVGWSRDIVCYRDTNPEDSKRQALEWKGGCWHDDDILSCDFCPPDLLATASYDGAILVWNADHEKLHLKLRDGYQEAIEKKMCRAQGITPPPTRSSRLRRQATSTSGGSSSGGGGGGMSRPNSRHRSAYQMPARSPAPVDKLVFLKRRAAEKRHRESGFLVTSDAGIVRFWSVHGRRHELAAFRATVEPDECVLAMASNRKDTALLTGDTGGFVRCWSIANYALFQSDKTEATPPHCLQEFRAHEAAIVSVDLAEIEAGDFVVTASVDCTAKLFTISGEAVGTFGQPRPWNIALRKTWKQAQIDREKFFEDVEAIDEEATDGDGEPEDSATVNAGQLATQLPDSSSARQSDDLTDQDTPHTGYEAQMKAPRSQTMPSMADSGGYKPLIGAKAEKDFERIRLSRSDRRNEFGGSSTQRAVAPGSGCAPYTVLKTTEFKSFSLSDNLPQPSWRANRSRTTVGLATKLPISADGHQSTDEDEAIDRDESWAAAAGQALTERANQRQVRLPPIASSPRPGAF